MDSLPVHWCATFLGLAAMLSASDGPSFDDRLPFPPFRNSMALSEAEEWTCDRALTDLDAESFDVREAAQETLLSFGRRVEPFTRRAIAELDALKAPSFEVLQRMKAIRIAISNFPKSMGRIPDGYLEALRKRTPIQDEHPAPSIFERLERRVSLQVSGAPVEEVLARLERQMGIPVASDPELEDAGPTLLSLEIRDASCRSALTAVCQQANCIWIHHRGGILVGPAGGRIQDIGTVIKSLHLSPPAGPDRPWTEEETGCWRAAVIPQPTSFCPWAPDFTPPIVYVGAPQVGVLEVRGLHEELDKFDRWFFAAQEGWGSIETRFPAVHAWAEVLRRPVGRVFKDEPFDVALRRVLGGKNALWRLHADVAGEDHLVACSDARVSCARWLQDVCSRNKWVVIPTMKDGHFLLYFRPPSFEPFEEQCVVPYSIRLPDENTQPQLDACLRSSAFPCAGQRLRDRWIGYADLWSVLCMESLCSPAGARGVEAEPGPPAVAASNE